MKVDNLSVASVVANVRCAFQAHGALFAKQVFTEKMEFAVFVLWIVRHANH